ncbi:Peroxisomal biogenesis factor 2, partial [Tolypocladium paradoxum]
ALAPAWAAAASREGTRPAFRVSQVDAELLDEELVELLRGQVGDALKYFAGGHLHDDWSAEIMLALRAVLFKLTVWDHDATYGAALQNLKYTDARQDGPVLTAPSRLQKSLYGLVTVFGKYAWTRWEDWLLEQDDGYGQPSPRIRLLSRLTSRLSTAHSAAAFASFLVFLLHGRYRTLLDRILRMRLAPPTSQVSREVSFEYLNRQLVWHAFTEFLLFVLPLIGINRWRRWLSRTWRKTKEIVHAGAGDDGGAAQGEYAFLPERTCAICYRDQNDAATTETEMLAAGGVVGSAQTDVTNPYEAMPCGCIYCFVCLATRLEREEGEGWTCLRCGEHVKECRPWSGDVLEPAARKPSSAKMVAFTDDVTGGLLEEEVPRRRELDSDGASD